jgi:hypothetical protein
MKENQRQENGLALQLLLKIRGECCDGKTHVEMSNLNDISMNILKRMDLVDCRTLEKELVYYVGVNEKGRTLARQFGAY